MLDRQSQDWLTPDNIDEKLNVQLNQILPPTILSHVDYYDKLNRYALYLEQGLDKEADDIKYNKKIIKYKNDQLALIYEELKTIIKHLTYTEENSVFALYIETSNKIKSSLQSNKNDQSQQLIDHCTYLFKKIITLIRLENEKPNNKIEVIESQLKALTMIIVLWRRYTDVIYTPDNDIENILNDQKESQEESYVDRKTLEELIEEGDPNNLKNYYFNRISEKKTKGQGLFINKFLGLYDDPTLRKKVEDIDRKIIDKNEIKVTNIKRKKIEEQEEEEEMQEEIQLKNQVEGEKKLTPNKQKETLKKKRVQVKGEKRKLIETQASEVFGEEEEWDLDDESPKTKGKKLETSSSSHKNQDISQQKIENISESELEKDPLNPNYSTITNKLSQEDREIINEEKANLKRNLLYEHLVKNIKIGLESKIYFLIDRITYIKDRC